MALFKYTGTAEELATKKVHDGFIYVCSNDDPEDYSSGNPLMGEWFVDIGTARYRLAAAALIDSEGNIVSVEDLVNSGDILSIEKGGTGKKTLIKNSLLVGNEDQPVQEIEATKGALYVDQNGNTPQYGTLPIELGGTNAADAEQARNNLEIYSKEETDTAVNKVASFSYARTLTLNGWKQSGNDYVQSVQIPELRCGKNGNVPPLVTWNGDEDTYDSYCTILGGEATPGSGIQFKVSGDNMPDSNIEIIIIDIA